MRSVPPGSVLIGVDGELLNVDNYTTLFAKVHEWTDIQTSLPPTPPAEGGEGEGKDGEAVVAVADDSSMTEQQASASKVNGFQEDGLLVGAESTEGDAASAAEEASDSTKADNGMETAVVNAGGGGSLRLTFRLQAKQGLEVQDVFPLGLENMRLAGTDKAMEEEMEAHLVLINDFRQLVGDATIPERLAEHFLVMSDWNVLKAQEQVRD